MTADLTRHGSGVSGGVVTGRRVRVSLLLMTPDSNWFVLESDASRLACLELTLTEDHGTPDTFGSLVEAAAFRKLNRRLSYIGLLSFSVTDQAYEFVALVALRETPSDAWLSSMNLRLVTLPEISRSTLPVDHRDEFETAWQRCSAERVSGHLERQIDEAFANAQTFLARRISNEDGQRGWSQYLDGRTVGSLSTAQGVLTLVHAGYGGDLVEEMVVSIEKMQNLDGGWQVRRALVGRPSELSITESTCFCLWALLEAGRTIADSSVERGIAWLEKNQGSDGGWQSSAVSGEAQVSATAGGVRILARLARWDGAKKGIAWLHDAQRTDGGWGPGRVAQNPSRDVSSPAYTAHAMLGLLAADSGRSDPAVGRGCEYLASTFEAVKEEPWQSSMLNTLVDDKTEARLEFRHFATPWVLVALSQAGRDLSDPMVLVGTTKLLALQEPSGAFRSDMTPGVSATWAVHDAVYALRTVRDASGKNLSAVVTAALRDQERAVMQKTIGRLIVGDPPALPSTPRRRWLQTAWLSALTVAVVMLIVTQTGILSKLLGAPLMVKALAAIVAATAAAAPSVITEEYKLWRRGKTGNDRTSGGLT